MDLDISKITHVHFIGIGGIGVSAIARMMLDDGKVVSGQDMQKSEITDELIKLGMHITIGQKIEAIPKDADLIVYTIAIELYDPELFEKLQHQEVPIRSYPEMLGIISYNKYTIAIAGTHGKTTTTGMVTQILRDTGNDPTVVIGSLLIGEHSNFIAGKSQYFIVEACEYRRSFLNISPKILVITNVDADHLDYYKDIEDIKSAFRELALKVPKDGFVICNPTDPHMIDVVAGIEATIVDYERFYNENIQLQVPGVHNKQNAACAKAIASSIGIDEAKIDEALSSFRGTWRRFEYKGDTETGAKVYDDYAHHPTEILASLQGFRELYPKSDDWRIVVVFQPHLFSRTKALLDDFGKSFSEADEVLLLPIYYAREENDGTVSSDILKDKIVESGIPAKVFPDFETAHAYITDLTLGPKNVIITMGAGEAFVVGNMLFNK